MARTSRIYAILGGGLVAIMLAGSSAYATESHSKHTNYVHVESDLDFTPVVAYSFSSYEGASLSLVGMLPAPMPSLDNPYNYSYPINDPKPDNTKVDEKLTGRYRYHNIVQNKQ